MSSEQERALVPVLLALTTVTGLVDAVSVLGLGRVFTANMTGNVAFLGFALVGAPGFSLVRSSAALGAFLLGAAIGGRVALSLGAGSMRRPTSLHLGTEAGLFLAGTFVAAGVKADFSSVPVRLYALIGLTGVAMGIRNAVVRRLAVPDLTTTVLTLTITGLAADSSVAGGQGPRWQRRAGSAGLMLIGAAAGAWLVARSVAVALAVATVISGTCALMVYCALGSGDRTVVDR